LKQGIVVYSWTFAFQILNTLLYIGIIFFIYRLVVILPRRLKRNEERIEKIESMLEKIEDKLK